MNFKRLPRQVTFSTGFGRKDRMTARQEGEEARRVGVNMVTVDRERNGWIREPGHVLIVE